MWLHHTDKTKVTKLLTKSVPRILGGKQVLPFSLLRDNSVCLTFLVSLVLICDKDLKFLLQNLCQTKRLLSSKER